ncbi:MAG: hypothetical protein WHT09_17105, partial [Thermogutta sp.]
MKRAAISVGIGVFGVIGAFLLYLRATALAESPQKRSSYSPVVIEEDFETIVKRKQAEKPKIREEHMRLLEERYDLSNRPVPGVTMSRGKP